MSKFYTEKHPALQEKFAKATETKIIAEIAKDLTNHMIAEIERLLMTERYQR